jgi:small-conductance mechanosensitive channel
MFENLSTSSITALFPALNYTLPYLGEVNLAKPLTALILFLGLTLIFWFVRMVLLIRIKIIAKKTSNNFDDALIGLVEGIRGWFYTIVALFVALQVFNLNEVPDKIFTGIFLFAVVWQSIEIATTLIKHFTTNFLEKDEDGDGQIDPNSAMASDLVTLISRILLWSLGILFVLSNLGIEVTSLIAGLGIGGLAIAFALQGVLGDLFASFSLYFDKPFRIGDFIVIGSDAGNVEKIGIKTTRIRTLQGEELVISNTELTTARVQNFKKMAERRIVTEFGITYETKQELVREVPGIVSRIFADLEGGRLDRVHFTTFADSALVFEVVYYVQSSDYTQYLNIQQNFNFDLMKRFSEVGIEFAYPTQTLYTKSIS